MDWIDPPSLDLPSLARTWRGARPFRHVVIDEVLGAPALEALRGGVAREPHWSERGEIVEAMASVDGARGEVLRDFASFLGGAAARELVHAITGLSVDRVELRSYVYLAGSYLLPHTDHRVGLDRRVAWVLYLSPPGSHEGGQLDLYACRCDPDDPAQIVATTIEATIEPSAGRLVLLEVSPLSLHRVREVTSGARVSLAGWFL